MNNNKSVKYWLWLTMIFGVASRRIWEVMRYFQHAQEACEALCSGIFNDRLDDNELKNLSIVTLEKVSSHIEACEKAGIGVVGYESEEYPRQLRHILNPPAVLYYKGNISCLSCTRTVTSVGARRATDYSLYAADKICRELARNGIVIVSGFAVGIDITSHLAAVSVKRPTACVMGCGLDVDYPRENFRFREAVLNAGGVFVSEFPPGTPPHSPNFPKRNRILAALGRVTVVFEASQKSGSLITAKLALEQGREVFCLPPANIFSDCFSGNTLFLSEGATPLYSVSDVTDCFRIGEVLDKEIREEAYSEIIISDFGVQELAHHYKKTRSEKPKTERKKKLKEKPYAESEEKEESLSVMEVSASQDYGELTELQKNIAELLHGEALHADVISQRLSVSPSELMTELTELEIEGIIRSLPGKMYEIIK